MTRPNNPIPEELRPAALLEGVTLEDGWAVGRRLERSRWASGVVFSYGYEAVHPTRGDGFLKALDYSRALASEDAAASLKSMTEAYVHERELLERCSRARLSKVVLPLAHGQVTLPGHLIPVNYLVFERAEGDVRDRFAVMEAFDLAWALRVLHDTAVGIQQLHGEGIAHQDVKPSNIVTFSSGPAVKIADLGRGDHRGTGSPHSGAQVAGDWTYAPPEQLYGSLASDWATRRRSCDLYHLGSMVSFFFLGMPTTPAILARLEESQYPVSWGESYEAILPFVRDAFDEVALALGERLPEICRDRVGLAFRELCDPEPGRRGNPRARSQRHGDPFAVARYVSIFDLEAKRAEHRLRVGG